MNKPTVGFVGFGEAAQCFARHLSDVGAAEIIAFCDGPTNHPPYEPAFRELAARCGARLVDSITQLAQQSEVIFSAVVVATAEPVGRAIARELKSNTILVDINASTPAQKRAIADAVAYNGGRYVDANLMGSVSIYGARVTLYCSGDGARRFAEMFSPMGLSIEVADGAAGNAATVKMLRSVVTKGIEALVIEALTAASRAGVRQEALRGICEPMDATSFSSFVDMCVRSDALHAERRAIEMDGVAASVREIGVAPLMTEATCARLRASAALGLRERFATAPRYTADDVLDAYAAEETRRAGA
ncbi:DUF1932 domain-containing protein [Terrarubrum flagellatum]|uniref:DUF1932 domain-containing protein n=1 Tax=Terrirubrum flagellatum TaxID=2895980 RepID=UPI0031456443